MSLEHRIPSASNIESAFKKYRMGIPLILEGAEIETGRTPKEVIWTKNKAKLYHYVPRVKQQFPVPILLVYALINRPYILDLIPGNSFVEYLLCQGFDVYLLDWGIPGDEDERLSFGHYVLDYLPRAAKKVLRTSQAKEFTLFGYCMGGTMSAMYAALFPDPPLKNLVLLTTPIDFSPENLGFYRLWGNEKYFNPDLVVQAFGNVPPEFAGSGNRMIKFVTDYIGACVAMWQRTHRDESMDTLRALNSWVYDGVPFPGEAFRQWVCDFYQHNKLVKREIKLRGRTVDLTNITCSLLGIAGKQDYICTLSQAEALMSLIGSQDKEFFVLDAGHVDLLTGTDTREVFCSKVRSWLEFRSQ